MAVQTNFLDAAATFLSNQEEGKMGLGIRSTFMFQDAVSASSNLWFKYLKSAFKVGYCFEKILKVGG